MQTSREKSDLAPYFGDFDLVQWGGLGIVAERFCAIVLPIEKWPRVSWAEAWHSEEGGLGKIGGSVDAIGRECRELRGPHAFDLEVADAVLLQVFTSLMALAVPLVLGDALVFMPRELIRSALGLA